MKNSLKETTRKLSDGTDQLLKQLRNGLSKLGDMASETKDKFINYVTDVFEVLPLLEEAGFRTNRLIVGVSVPPSVEIHFNRFNVLSKDELDELRTRYAKKKMFKMILKSLLLAHDFQGRFSSSGLEYCETCVEITIPPKVSIKYLNKELITMYKLEKDFD